jgi:two-component system, OmpR family, KDP operon response regulator KdpE
MTGPRVLVVDDEQQILRFLKPSLTAAGYDVMTAATGADALKQTVAHTPAVVLLDLGLPDMDGKEVIRRIREWSEVPIVVLSARDREAEKIAALDLGADDYVNKPFAIGELLARVRTSLRRGGRGSSEPTQFTCGHLIIDIPAHTVTLSGEQIKLTPKEFDLLTVLVRNAGRVVTHRQILSTVWGPAHVDDLQYLRVFVAQLRHKLRTTDNAPELIQTEPGIGYRVAGDPP